MSDNEDEIDTKTLLKMMLTQQKQICDLVAAISGVRPEENGEPTTSFQAKTQAQRDLELISKISPRINKFVFDPDAGSTFPSWYERNGEILTTDGAGYLNSRE